MENFLFNHMKFWSDKTRGVNEYYNIFLAFHEIDRVEHLD